MQVHALQGYISEGSIEFGSDSLELAESCEEKKRRTLERKIYKGNKILLTQLIWQRRRHGGRIMSKKGETKDENSLTGYWKNELNSCMFLEQHEDGTLTGKYLSDVGNPGGVQNLYGTVGTGKPTTFGFAVTFEQAKSSTAWSGLYQSCDGKDKLTTTWILANDPGSCNNDWQAFNVGQDVFFRSYIPCMKI